MEEAAGVLSRKDRLMLLRLLRKPGTSGAEELRTRRSEL
jgi:hypothetical protein